VYGLVALLDSEPGMKVRGIHVFTDAADKPVGKQGSKLRKCAVFQQTELDILLGHKLSIDIDLLTNGYCMVRDMLAMHPELTVIVNLQNWCVKPDAIDRYIDNIVDLMSYENAYIKVCRSIFTGTGDYDVSLAKLLNKLVAHMGYERIMFATGAVIDQSVPSFNEHWATCVRATTTWNAGHREKLFRDNAVSVYRL